MDKNTDRLFFKSGAAYMIILISGVFLFLALAALQLMVTARTKYFIGVSLMLLSFLLSVTLGKFGFYISFVLNLMQCLIFSYEYFRLGNQAAPLLGAMAFTAMIANLLIQYYITRVAAKIARLEKEHKAIRN